MVLFRFLNICHNLLMLSHVAEFKLVLGSLAFPTEPAGLRDLGAVFVRLWERRVSTAEHRGHGTPPPGRATRLPVRWGPAGWWLKATCGTGWVNATDSGYFLNTQRAYGLLNECQEGRRCSGVCTGEYSDASTTPASKLQMR